MIGRGRIYSIFYSKVGEQLDIILVMSEKKYIRDGRAPIPINESTSKIMRANKARNTKPELILRKALYQSGMRGYRIHWKKAPGSPDIAFPGRKIAIFVNGCFWHRCPNCKPSYPKTNVKFWTEKFQKNIERDKRKIDILHLAGWKTFTFWECNINNDSKKIIKTLMPHFNN